MLKELERTNAPAYLIDQYQAKQFELWPEHLKSWEIFIQCQTQWRLIPMGGMQGIDYIALNSVMDINGIDNKQEIFNEIRLIEHGALQELKNKNGK